MRLGCIADDYTGATDLASALTESGLRVIQLFGAPELTTPAPDGPVDAVVVALKIRNLPARAAVRQARDSLAWLTTLPVETVMFKYCSTFDSTPAGNIGPVHDALLEQLGEHQSISTPANPENGRTVYLGHLFVGQQLLSDSGMRSHPLTPMSDSALPRVLAAQSRSDVRLLPLPVVRSGAKHVRAYLRELRDVASGRQIVICDALNDADLDTIAEATADMRLVAGAAGLGRAAARVGSPPNVSAPLPAAVASAARGPAAVLAGSCSPATLAQVEAMARLYPTFRLDAEQLDESPDLVGQVVDWARRHLPTSPVLVAASQPPDQVARAQHRLGSDRAAELVETALGAVALQLRRAGLRKLIVAGGETSGAVINHLGVRRVRIGPPLAPGVPWVYTDEEDDPLLLALKSGNFGSATLFIDAVGVGLDGSSAVRAAHTTAGVR